MSKLVYVGNNAGLQTKSEMKAGDMNSLADYVLTCVCGTLLGPVARFMPNADGFRTPWCPTCSHCTLIDKNGQILKVFHVDLSRKTG